MATKEWILEVKRDIRECVICSSTERLTIDHDHATNQIRGVLCNNCNLGIGQFRDDPELLDFAAEYLRQILK